MPLKFFTINAHHAGEAEKELNAFLRQQRVLGVERRFVDDGANSYWAVCVDYLDAATGDGAGKRLSGSAKGKVDYREVLSAENFALFARLRDWRKQIAREEAVPVYTVFTNEQLAEIVRRKSGANDELGRIAGVGGARLDKDAQRLLGFLKQQHNGGHETDGKSVPPVP